MDHGGALAGDAASVVQRVCVRGRGGLAAVRQLGDYERVPGEARGDCGIGEAGDRAAVGDARDGHGERPAGGRASPGVLAEQASKGPEHVQSMMGRAGPRAGPFFGLVGLKCTRGGLYNAWIDG